MNKRCLFWITMFAVLVMGINLAQAGPGTHALPVIQPQPFGQVNTYYANSPAGPWVPDPAVAIPNVTPSDSGTPLRKFVDSLPGLGPLGANNLGNYIPVASKAQNPIAGDPADYYEIEVVDYRQRLHSDLPATGTKLRGYRDLTPAGNNGPARYLGPVIIAKTFDPTRAANVGGNGAPVRIKYKNSLGLGAAGNLFIPVDTTAMGAGEGPLSQTWDPVTLTLQPTGNTQKYGQNRAELHLHGGVTPWISDGTPHQWFTPAGETSPYKRGVSQQNVPDMPDPGDGYATYYYSNQQSARLMFYHDHAYGLTRLNVYAGEAAGYLLYDQPELDMISGTNVSGINTFGKILPDNGGGLYTFGIPLIIQDKTFVPKDVAVQDAKWDTTRWGAYGDLWFPHVYEPNQNPLDALGGANPYGRWDYGPWFWPPVVVPAAYAALPSTGTSTEPSLTPEAFMDTPLVNGEAYPYLPVEPKAYRFRILNAANDRPFNLQLYESNPTSVGNFIQGGYPTEVAMVPASLRPDCTAASIAATPAVPSTCTCTASFAPFGCFPATWPTDGRAGGVPDPQFAGPKMIQIGTEGGLLPTPVVLDNQPISYEYNRRTIVVLDVLDKTLLMGPAERADVIIDFTAYAGKTVILYNDAPAPNPAFDIRYDYFTNGPDLTNQGGAPSTKAGYGPNTRTIMQFRVAASAAAPFTYDAAKMATLTTAIQTAFTSTQPAPIVPEPDYAANYPADPSPNLTTAIYSTIFDNSLTFTPLGGGASTTINFESKAIQELWDPWGRMNATLGVELPKTSNTIQTTIPFGYVDPTTEIVDHNLVQLWKITHNGVDTHPVHFHLFDVQLINRVGWDGAIRPPDANEIGWKETVKMKPLEDVIVALRPVLPSLPFGIPTSTRLQDPTLPVGAQNNGLAGFFDGTGAGFMGLNPVDGTPIIVTNSPTNYGHEYVWHCHILGHEENDFMRPMVVNDISTTPATPTSFAASLGTGAINLSWVDTTRPAVLSTYGNPRNEVGFHIYRCSQTAATPNCTPTVLAYTVPANATSFVDHTLTQNLRYRYRITAFNASGESPFSTATSALLTPATLPPYVSITAPASASKFALGAPITISATASAAVGLTITRVDFYAAIGAGTPALIGSSTTAPYTFTWTPSPAAAVTYNLTARAVDNHTTPQTSTSAIVPISVVSLSVAITAPASNTAFNLGAPIPLTATATTVTGLTVTTMEFYDGATLIGSSAGPAYAISWTNATTGTHTVTAKAYYNNGANVTSPPITVDVLGTTITSPVTGTAFNLGAPIAIAATAAPVSGLTVQKVDFFADGILIGTDATAPYTFTWNGATGGVHSLTATATYSNAVTAPSPAISIVVLSTTITAPLNGSSSMLGTLVPITASVPTVAGLTVTKVDFFANAALIGTSTTSPYSVSWSPAASGPFSLTATATYSNAATSSSPAVAVTVTSSVVITAPASGATSAFGTPITITVTATPPAGSTVILVEYYADGAATPIGYSTVSPYSYSWTTATAAAHNLTAKAYYSNGTTSTSIAVPITVNNVAATMISPPSPSALASGNQTFTWTNTGASVYQIWVGTALGTSNLGMWPPAGTTSTSTTVTGLTSTGGGTLYVRLWSLFGSNWIYNDYTYTVTGTAAIAATMVTPTSPSVLASGNQTFTWTNTGADKYQIWAGTTQGTSNLGMWPPAGTTSTSTTLTGLTPGSLYVRLWSLFGSNWVYNDYTYTVSGTPVVAATMVSPTSPSTISISSQIFNWTNAGADKYQIWIGTTLGTSDLGMWPPAGTTTTSTTITGLTPAPVAGSTLYVRLWSLFGSNWLSHDYTYTSGP